MSCRGCGASVDTTFSSIPCGADWPVSRVTVVTVEYVSAAGGQLETIVSRLSVKLGGSMAHSEDSYRKIGADERCIDIIRRGYKPIWIRRTPRQGMTPRNPTISTKASEVLDTEVIGLLEKGAVREVGPVQGQFILYST